LKINFGGDGTFCRRVIFPPFFSWRQVGTHHKTNVTLALHFISFVFALAMQNKEDAIKSMRAQMKQLGISLAELSSSPPESPSPPAASPLSVASNEPLSIEDVRKSAEEFASDNDLFLQWYFGQEGVKTLVAKVNNARRVQGQNRAFIGLVQATMMGTCSQCVILVVVLK
jgi:hypothetical protein